METAQSRYMGPRSFERDVQFGEILWYIEGRKDGYQVSLVHTFTYCAMSSDSGAALVATYDFE